MLIRRACLAGVLTVNILAALGSASAQQIPPELQPSPPSITVYVQASDARFDSYLIVKRVLGGENKAGSADDFFFIPRGNSKGREKEFADWRRKFNLIVSAASLAEIVQPKIAQVKEEFSQAASSAECWTVDKNRERRITVTVVGSASEAMIKREYQAASREFIANPDGFTCKYAYWPDASTPNP